MILMKVVSAVGEERVELDCSELWSIRGVRT